MPTKLSLDASIVRTEARLATINGEVLALLVDPATISRIVGFDITGDSVTPEQAQSLYAWSKVIEFQKDLEEALSNRDMDAAFHFQTGVLTSAFENDAAALSAYGAALGMATIGLTGGMSVVHEAGTCPNGNEDCPVNAYADALYVLAKEAGDRHGVEVPDLGVTERRFSNRSEVEAYLKGRTGESIMGVLGRLLGGTDARSSFGQPDKPASYGGGAWGSEYPEA